MNDLKTERLQIKLSKSIKEKLKELAKSEKRSMANYIDNLIEIEFEKLKERGN